MRIWREASFNRFIICEGKLGKCDTMCDRVSVCANRRAGRRGHRLDRRTPEQRERAVAARHGIYALGHWLRPSAMT